MDATLSFGVNMKSEVPFNRQLTLVQLRVKFTPNLMITYETEGVCGCKKFEKFHGLALRGVYKPRGQMRGRGVGQMTTTLNNSY